MKLKMLQASIKTKKYVKVYLLGEWTEKVQKTDLERNISSEFTSLMSNILKHANKCRYFVT